MMPKSSPVRCTILMLAAVTIKREQNKNTLQEAPVWSRPNTLRRLSQKSFYNSRVLERNQLRVPWCEEDVGAFIVVRSCLLSLQPKSFLCRASLILVGQVFSLQGKSCPCSPSPFLAEQVFKNLKRGGQVWAFVLSGTPHKEWAQPSFGPWTWIRWARQALSHILSSSSTFDENALKRYNLCHIKLHNLCHNLLWHKLCYIIPLYHSQLAHT